MKYNAIKFISVALVILMLVMFGVSALAASADNQWTYLSDEFYSKVCILGDKILLFERIKDKDVLEIEKAITNYESFNALNSELSSMIINDPNACFTDNMSPNGLFYYDNKDEIAFKMLDDLSSICVVSKNNDGKIQIDSIPKESAVLLAEQSVLDFCRVQYESNSFYLPKTMDYSGETFIVSSNEQYTLVPRNDCIYLINNNDGAIHKLLTQWENKTYEEVQNLSSHFIFWSDEVTISPDCSKFAYVSNKNNDSGRCNVFVCDFKNDFCLIKDISRDYNVLGWIDNNTILCRENADNAFRYVALSDSGEILDYYDSELSDYLGMQNGNILLGWDNLIKQVKWSGDGFKDVGIYKVDGSYRIRPGINPFNENGTRFAVICAPKLREKNRNLMIVDLKTQETKICEFKCPSDKSVGILEFDWLYDNELLVTVKDFDSLDISSWLYRCK